MARNLFAEEPVQESTGVNLFSENPIQQDTTRETFVSKEAESDQSFAGGVGQSLLQGATLGFSDEIQSVIAATVAAPFVSDKTFGQLMTDARASFRADQEKFIEENPATALGLEVAGGLATGGIVSAGKKIASQTLGKTVAQGTGIGAIAGAGFADEEELLSKETAEKAVITGTVGAAFNVLSPLAIKAAVQVGKLIPKDAPRKLMESALKFRPGVDPKTRSKMTETTLREGILPTVSGLNKITQKLNILDDSLNTIIDDATEKGLLIPKKAFFTQLKELRKDLGGAKLEAGTDLKHIDAVVKAFDEQLKTIKKLKLTPREAQELKTDAYKRINFDLTQGKASFAKNETRKSIARAAKESLEEIDPNVKAINQRMGDLLQLEKELKSVVNKLDNRNLISLDTAVKIGAGAATGTPTGTVIGATAAGFGSPRIKARIALMLENLRNLSELDGVIGKLPVELSTALSVLVGRETDSIKEQISRLEDE